jgi:transposase
MSKTHVEVITSVQRRSSWSRAEKERIVAAALEPGAVASEVARAAGIHSSQYFAGASSSVNGRKFRRRYPVAITAEPEAEPLPAAAERAGVIEIELAIGGRMRITGPVDVLTVAALMKALAKGKRRRRSRAERRAGLASGRPYRHDVMDAPRAQAQAQAL